MYPFNLIFVGIIVVLAATIVVAVRASRAKPTAPPEADGGHGAGSVPFARPNMIEGPNERIIDLRPLPDEDLHLGRFGCTAAIVRVHGPKGVHLFVVSMATAKAWLAMSDTALIIVLGRLREMRTGAPGLDALYVADGKLDDDGQSRFAGCGMQVALDFAIVGSERTVTIAEALASPAPPAGVGPKRPISRYRRHGLQPLAQDLVFEIDRAMFIDLRRARPAALESLSAFDVVDEALGKMTDDGEKLLIWFVAPWVFARWQGRQDAVVARVASWVRRHPGRHRLAVYDGNGDEPMSRALAALGMTPLVESLTMITASDQWRVPLAKVLDDIAGYDASLRYAPKATSAAPDGGATTSSS